MYKSFDAQKVTVSLSVCVLGSGKNMSLILYIRILECKHSVVSKSANNNIAYTRNKLTCVQTVMYTVLAIIFSSVHYRAPQLRGSV